MFGDCPLKPGWHQRIMLPEEMRWTWMFHQTEGAPVTKGLELLPGSSALNRDRAGDRAGQGMAMNADKRGNQRAADRS